MSTTTVGDWLQRLDISEKPDAFEIKGFFGVPPDPEEELDENIRRKRRAWRSKLRERKASPAAERKVTMALRLIGELERRLKRGVVDEDFDLDALREEYTAEPQTHVDEIDTLWRVLEELLAAGRPEEALRVANEARVHFPEEAQAHAGFAWMAAVASRSDPNTSTVLRREGLTAAQKALDGGDVKNVDKTDLYAWTSILQLDLKQFTVARDTLNAAEQALGSLTPWLHSHRCEAHAGLQSIDAAAKDALAAVRGAPEDFSLRSNTAAALVTAARNSLLPISSGEMLNSYKDLIMLAAWCANGVPEAEDYVRPYRLWAAQAASRSYVGRVEIRSIMAVLSGFLLLPVLNRTRSQPVWKMFLEGPTKHGEMGEVVATSPIAEFVHQGLEQKLTWSR
jgi:hypothetical protein